MRPHEHRWTLSGIVTEGTRLGMAHSRCECGGELYLPATMAELKRHDPRGDVVREMKRLGFPLPGSAGPARRRRAR